MDGIWDVSDNKVYVGITIYASQNPSSSGKGAS